MYTRLRLLLLLVALMNLVSPSRATTADTNNSDLWWVPTESGWGIQFVQQANVIFATMFVYGPSHAPVWYTATLDRISGDSGFTYSGPLYLTNGPWFGGGPFDPASVTNRTVGTMTFDVPYVETGTLTYSVDGVAVTKTIERQTLRFENFTGNYVGALERLAGGCANTADNGQQETYQLISISQVGTNFSATTTAISGGPSCSYSGTYSQSGHMGTVHGTYTCNNGDSGSIWFVEMEVSRGGFTSRFYGQNSSCTNIAGRLGGVVRTPNF